LVLAAWFEGGQFDVRALCEIGEGFAEVHGVVALDEGEGVSTCAADEAVEDLLCGNDAHGWGVVVVEGADADIFSAFGFECDAVPHHAHNVGRIADALDIIVGLWLVETHAINSPGGALGTAGVCLFYGAVRGCSGWWCVRAASLCCERTGFRAINCKE